MIRCWNCGLPDVAQRCPRCGAPQEQAGRGAPPPSAAPPEAARPPSGFIGDAANLRPPANRSGPFPASGNRSGPLRPAGNQSGPLPPGGGYPPPGLRRGPVGLPPPAPGGSFPPLPPDEARMPPEYRRGVPPPRSDGGPAAPAAPRGWADHLPPEPPYALPARATSGAVPRGGLPLDWEAGPVADLPDAGLPTAQGEQGGDVRGGKRGGEAAPQIARRPELIWDESDHWGWREPDELSLSAATNAVLGGAFGGVLGGAIWVVAVALTGLSLPYLTVVVGLLAGLGARFALAQTRPWILGAFGAVGAALAYLLTQYGLFDYALVREGFTEGLFALAPLSFPQVYIDYVTGGSDDALRALGVSGQHPLEMGLLLACMAVCWAILLRRK